MKMTRTSLAGRVGALALCLVLCGFSDTKSTAPAVPASSAPTIQIDFSNAGPREVEDKTESSVSRDYARAWHAMQQALEQNQASALGESFTGIAQERLAARIAQQRPSGLHTRYNNVSHHVQATFYSPDGSAMQLRDAAQVDLEIMDGSTVLSRQKATINYVTLMTATQDGWRVRLLQEVPAQ
jgi:hypothetical protein